MGKIKYISRSNAFYVYFDKVLFKTENEEVKFMFDLFKKMQVINFVGKCIVENKIEFYELLGNFSKIETSNENRGLFFNNIIVDISFYLNKLKIALDSFYSMDTAFEGVAIRNDGIKIGVVFNDPDGSCIIFNKEIFERENVRSFLNEWFLTR